MDFGELVKSLQEFVGVSRKNSIEKVTKALGEVYNISGEVLLDFGDDASAIDIGNNQVVLLAADGIWGQLMSVNPYWAGYCSVLVNVNDIAAMGGKPIAMVNTLSINDDEIYDELLQGIVDGCRKFNVPMVGGHLHPDAEFNSLDVAIAGIAKKDSMITSAGANIGDKVLVAIDTDGRQHPQFALNWDTTYDKDEKLVQDQIKVMQEIAERHLPTAGKDISNPGTLGTLEMLLEASGVGANVDLESIPKNPDVPWDEWLMAYPGAAFVMTAKEENCQEIIDTLSPYSFEVAVVGDVIDEKVLYLNYGEEKAVEHVAKNMGNVVADLDEPNLVAIFMGLILGILLGAIPFVIPQMSVPVKLGLAGGPIIVGILVGAYGPRLHMITYTTISANRMLRALGITVFLACLGLQAGPRFFDTVVRADGALWVMLGFLITVVPVIIVGWVAVRFCNLDMATMGGMVCGSMANPMALDSVNDAMHSDRASVAYTTVYPLSMFIRVIIVQVIIVMMM